jgi:hypothetical protein
MAVAGVKRSFGSMVADWGGQQAQQPARPRTPNNFSPGSARHASRRLDDISRTPTDVLTPIGKDVFSSMPFRTK